MITGEWSEYSVLIGQKLGLSEEDIRRLRIGGLFHDVGKIGVPDSILLKEGKLTDDEYSQIKNHPSIGAHILQNSEFFKDIIPIVKHHHEKYDGTGYPGKLKGEEIPFEARIMAIVDVYDALVSKRVYKEAFDFDKADRIIIEGMGTQFDPGLKSAYEKARERLEDYYGRNRD